ncbi:MAG: hypothetical protein US70_C0020G0019 [Parcubacteria group bacterium GW2011_GWD2_38_11]|nr:MAG: hypothetical protein US70_C0020G0019 [Parcubacteria group bacterium GW2011_GWD2_38_11]
MRNILIVVAFVLLVAVNAFAGPRQDDEERAQRKNNATAATHSTITPEVFRMVDKIMSANGFERKGEWYASHDGFHASTGESGFDRVYMLITWDGYIYKDRLSGWNSGRTRISYGRWWK